MGDLAAYLGLFLTSFLAATVLTVPSETALVALLLTKSYPAWLLLVVASIANTLGALSNWLLGRFAEQFRHRRWFPIRPASLARAEAWYARYGRWSLLLSWLPVVGDPLCFIGGLLRERFLVFLILVGIAKTARYAVVTALVLTGQSTL